MKKNGSIRAGLPTGRGRIVDEDNRQATVQILDNDPTFPPARMATPTVLPTDGRLQIFWEEPAHAGEREIDRYQITWTINNIPRRITAQGYRRHHSLRGPRNGATYAVQIQACKEGTTYCSELSDAVSATPTDSGPTITGPQTATLPEEVAGTVGQFTATPSTGGTIAWRLGGFESGFFSHTVNADGNMTLTLNEGYNFDDPEVMRQHHNLRVTVVATDSAPGQASSVIETTVTVTDVDETPVFDPYSITKGPYVVGEKIESFLLPAPKADEVPVTYETTELPPGLSRFGTRLIQGTPKLVETRDVTYTATDVDGDEGELTIKFTVVEKANHAPTSTEIGEYYLDKEGGTQNIGLGRFFKDEDGDALEFSATSSDTTVATTSVTAEILSITPVGLGTTEMRVTATDPAGLTASQSFTATVDYLPVVTIAPAGPDTQYESEENVRFTLTADPAPSEAMAVRISVSQQGADYLTGTIPEEIEFAKGSVSETLTLQVDDDDTGEPDGKTRVSILHLTGYPYTRGIPGTAEVTIRDNDTLTLNVEPMPLRRARVSWNPIPEVIRYELEIREQSGTWSGRSYMTRTKPNGTST